MLAHRFSWELHNGPIPKGFCVLHRCDNPPCVRPDHLFLGTHLENIRDMVKKNRGYDRHGEKNPRAKLTERKVIEIRRRYELGETQESLGREYGFVQAYISQIVLRKIWKNC